MLNLQGQGRWVLFVAYMIFCTNHGLLVTWTQNHDKAYGYNATAVVLHAEVLKLLVVSCLAVRSKGFSTLAQVISNNMKVLSLYFIPALLYAFNNILTFINLTHFDPTTFSILLQFKMVLSGIVYQTLFNRKLSGKQWLSLVLLTVGCMIKQINPSSFADGADGNQNGSHTKLQAFLSLVSSPVALLLLFQMTCSTTAGIFTELLIKRHGKNLDIWGHNIFMYLDSIVCGLVIFLASGQPFPKLLCLLPSEDHGPIAYRLKIAAVIVNMAAMGIVTSLFLKSLNSIVKNFAIALELILTAMLSWILFGIPINLFTFVAMAVVLVSLYIYFSSPLDQPMIIPRKVKLSESSDSIAV